VSSPVGDARPGGTRRAGRVAAIVTLAAVSMAAGAVAYHLATKRQPPPVQVAAVAASRPVAPEPATGPPTPESTPVLFRNPFDASEVFEFPSGTSQTEARDAVASLLLERARDRGVPRTEMKARSRKKTDQDSAVTATNLAQHD
jgi:hypothetical protein